MTILNELETATLLNKAYRIEAQAQAEGTGPVYTATNIWSGHLVLIQTLPRGAEDETLRAAKRQVTVGSLLADCPQLVPVSSFEYDRKQALYFLVLEDLPPRTLAGLVQREGALSVEHSSRLALDLCQSLSQLHERGVSHGAVQTEIVRLDEQGQAHLSDLSQAQLDRAAHTRLTQSITGEEVGLRLAPAEIQPVEKLDRTGDLGGLGKVLYEMLTGSPFKQGSKPSPGLLNPQIPAWLNELVSRLLEPRESKAFSSAQAVAQSMQEGLTSQNRAQAEPAERPALIGSRSTGPTSKAGQKATSSNSKRGSKTRTKTKRSEPDKRPATENLMVERILAGAELAPASRPLKQPINDYPTHSNPPSKTGSHSARPDQTTPPQELPAPNLPSAAPGPGLVNNSKAVNGRARPVTLK